LSDSDEGKVDAESGIRRVENRHVEHLGRETEERHCETENWDQFPESTLI
jgi:hypothetical protein